MKQDTNGFQKLSIEDGNILIPVEILNKNMTAENLDYQVCGRHSLFFSTNGGGKKKQNFSFCSSEMFAVYLDSLIQSEYSGAIVVEVEQDTKTLYFRDGRLVFASSTQIDDRLGEICYRANLINMDAFANSTVQVNNQIKFGQVLLKDRLMTHIGLSQALKLQVSEIARSLFLHKDVYFELVHGQKPFTEVLFLRGDRQVVMNAAAYGVLYKNFVERLLPETAIYMTDDEDEGSQFPPATFYGDIIDVLLKETLLDDVIKSFRLNRIYTLNAIMYLYYKGVIQLSPLAPVSQQNKPEQRSDVKAKIAAYNRISEEIYNCFVTEKLQFPLFELRHYAQMLDGDNRFSFRPNHLGSFDEASVLDILSQDQKIVGRSRYLVDRIDSLRRFIMQIAGDRLSKQSLGRIEKIFYEVV